MQNIMGGAYGETKLPIYCSVYDIQERKSDERDVKAVYNLQGHIPSYLLPSARFHILSFLNLPIANPILGPSID
jgi:hypothetical protein